MRKPRKAVQRDFNACQIVECTDRKKSLCIIAQYSGLGTVISIQHHRVVQLQKQEYRGETFCFIINFCIPRQDVTGFLSQYFSNFLYYSLSVSDFVPILIVSPLQALLLSY